MDCTQKSADGSLTFEYSPKPGDQDLKYGLTLRQSEVSMVQQEIQDIQKNDPGLFNKSIPEINAALVEKNLLPGFELVAKKDERGNDVDKDGNFTMLPEQVIEGMGLNDIVDMQTKAMVYTEVFDKFHRGFDGLNPLQAIWPAELTRENIKQALEDPNLPSGYKRIASEFETDFPSIAGWQGRETAISKDELNRWIERKSTYLENKLDAFVTGDPATKKDPHLRDENGYISIFDWQNKNDCAVDYNGNAYIRMMTF